MKELLQEAAKIQARAHDHLMELSAKLPMQYFSLVDSGIIQDLGNLMGRITAAIAEPEPDVELASDMEYGFVARYGSLTADGKTKDEAMQELARVILAAFNSAPEPDAMKIVRQVRDGSLKGLTWSYKHSTSEAAALIEGLQRRVPRAMLKEIWDEAYWCNANDDYKSIDEIAAKYGVEVEG